MVVEARQYPTGTLLAFYGTTEWALDSVQFDQTLRLPLEHQLRDLLGPAFHSLTRAPVGHEARAQISGRSAGASLVAAEATEAYALALLALIGAARS